MDKVIEFINTDYGFFLFLFIWVAVTSLMIKFLHKRFKNQSFAKWLAEVGQFEPLSKEMLAEAIKYAEKNGEKAKFLSLLNSAQLKLGGSNIKVGHLFWIRRTLLNGFVVGDDIDIPTYNPKKACVEA